MREVWEEFFPDQEMPRSFLKGLRPLLKRVRRNNIAPVRIRIKAGRDLLGAASFYVVDNCLARPDFSIYNMKDPSYVPLRILVEGEEKIRKSFEEKGEEVREWIQRNRDGFTLRWRGVIQTYSKKVEVQASGKEWKEKRILIVAGIDPQIDLFIDAGEFMRKLEGMFLKIAIEKGYDYIVLPFPEGMISSRRTFIVPEVKRSMLHSEGWRETLRVRKPIGFPRKGEGESNKAFYHDQKQDQFIVFISEDQITKHTSPGNPTRPPRKKIP